MLAVDEVGTHSENHGSLPAETIDTETEIDKLTDTLSETLIDERPEDEIYWQTSEWKRKKHTFVLSSAGKPIYSR